MKKNSIIAMVTIGVIATTATPEISNKLLSQCVTVVAVSKEYQNALETAKMVKDANMSKKAFYDMMVNESKFKKKAVDYAVKKLKISWKKNALAQAKSMQKFGASKEMIKEQLSASGDGGGFTKKEVNYAIKHLEDDIKDK
ncbi:Ltp family lipoprotein [Streptococcus phocae subsp. salmonis]|uniref:Ltp family lipoprotein n=1 Tax=Streptococcus phocae TaxID=119224 RepID=UPI0005315B35|nr:Ltp family lipoprotein [Streptococcus phocae]KGR72865.1 hypothetical protein NX86_03785 [Streptococcus phocae subsp. salmonis]QBX27802.1 putative superinfection immunity protein [Streptococcus phage Javan420]